MSIATKSRKGEPAPARPPALSDHEAAEALRDLHQAIDGATARLGTLDAGIVGMGEDEALAERATLENWLGKAREVAAAFVATRGRSVAEAIAAAGGAETVGTAARHALLIRGAWWQLDPSFAELQQLETTLGQVDAELATLGEHQYFPTDSPGERLINEQTRLRLAIESVKAGIDDRRGKRVARLIEHAQAGDAQAAAQLGAIVAGKPDAFHKDLGPALRAAAADREVAAWARDLADEQERRRMRWVREQRCAAMLAELGPAPLRAVGKLLDAAIAGDQSARIRLRSGAYIALGIGSTRVPPLAASQMRMIVHHLLDLADAGTLVL
jgi:hypothetical protein